MHTNTTGRSTDRPSAFAHNKTYSITWTDDTITSIIVDSTEDAQDAVKWAKKYHEQAHGVEPRLKYIRKVK